MQEPQDAVAQQQLLHMPEFTAEHSGDNSTSSSETSRDETYSGGTSGGETLGGGASSVEILGGEGSGHNVSADEAINNESLAGETFGGKVLNGQNEVRGSVSGRSIDNNGDMESHDGWDGGMGATGGGTGGGGNHDTNGGGQFSMPGIAQRQSNDNNNGVIKHNMLDAKLNTTSALLQRLRGGAAFPLVTPLKCNHGSNSGSGNGGNTKSVVKHNMLDAEKNTTYATQSLRSAAPQEQVARTKCDNVSNDVTSNHVKTDVYVVKHNMLDLKLCSTSALMQRLRHSPLPPPPPSTSSIPVVGGSFCSQISFQQPFNSVEKDRFQNEEVENSHFHTEQKYYTSLNTEQEYTKEATNTQVEETRELSMMVNEKDASSLPLPKTKSEWPTFLKKCVWEEALVRKCTWKKEAYFVDNASEHPEYKKEMTTFLELHKTERANIATWNASFKTLWTQHWRKVLKELAVAELEEQHRILYKQYSISDLDELQHMCLTFNVPCNISLENPFIDKCEENKVGTSQEPESEEQVAEQMWKKELEKRRSHKEKWRECEKISAEEQRWVWLQKHLNNQKWVDGEQQVEEVGEETKEVNQKNADWKQDIGEEMEQQRIEEMQQKLIEEIEHKLREEMKQRNREILEVKRREEMEEKRREDMELRRRHQMEIKKRDELHLKRKEKVEQVLIEEIEKKLRKEMERKFLLEIEQRKKEAIQRNFELEQKRRGEMEQSRRWENEQKQRAEIEQKQRAEIEQKQRAEIEQKQRAEIEQKHRVEMEQKQRAEMEQKQRAEMEQKQRVEMEQKQRAEMEQKQRAEMEQKQMVEIERKRKEEIEQKQTVEMEQQRKKEIEHKFKMHVEQKESEAVHRNEEFKQNRKEEMEQKWMVETKQERKKEMKQEERKTVQQKEELKHIGNDEMERKMREEMKQEMIEEIEQKFSQEMKQEREVGENNLFSEEQSCEVKIKVSASAENSEEESPTTLKSNRAMIARNTWLGILNKRKHEIDGITNHHQLDANHKKAFEQQQNVADTMVDMMRAWEGRCVSGNKRRLENNVESDSHRADRNNRDRQPERGGRNRTHTEQARKGEIDGPMSNKRKFEHNTDRKNNWQRENNESTRRKPTRWDNSEECTRNNDGAKVMREQAKRPAKQTGGWKPSDRTWHAEDKRKHSNTDEKKVSNTDEMSPLDLLLNNVKETWETTEEQQKHDQVENSYDTDEISALDILLNSVKDSLDADESPKETNRWSNDTSASHNRSGPGNHDHYKGGRNASKDREWDNENRGRNNKKRTTNKQNAVIYKPNDRGWHSPQMVSQPEREAECESSNTDETSDLDRLLNDLQNTLAEDS